MSVLTPASEAADLRAASSRVFVFAPFRLIPGQRRLERDGVEVQLGGRALEILVALVERAGEILSRQDLMARVWPDVTVDDGSLRFHLVGLRKALEETSPERFIATVPGKGYCFVAPVSKEPTRLPAPASRAAADGLRTLPRRPHGVVGREQSLRIITERLLARRFVSIVGPGGIGKTTVALCVAHELLSHFDNAVYFVDLASVSDPKLVAGEIAGSVGLIQYAGELTPGLVNFVRDKRLLLLLDNCEHVIGEAAAVAERLYQETKSVHILVTSREPLQVEGERVQRLFAFEYPASNQTPTAAAALEYPAVQYFVERASAATDSFTLDDFNAPLVAEICRQLDGVALAIELVAGGVEVFGLQGTAALLNSHFTLPFRGKRTASPRHQSLRAMLDWSYTLLSDFERLAMRRLAVFVGPFSIDGAEAVIVANEAKPEFFVEVLADLVSKSLIIAESEGTSPRYRLLSITRAYALERLNDLDEFDGVARLHAAYFQHVLEGAERDAAMLSQSDWLARYGGLLPDVRAALQRSFSARGDAGLGIGLASVAVKYLLEMSLISEALHWTERAIGALDSTTRGTRAEMLLRESLGSGTTIFRGNQEDVRSAFERGLEIAVSLRDVDHILRNLSQLTLHYVRIGDFTRALAMAQCGQTTAAADGGSSSLAMAEWMLGVCQNLAGNQFDAVSVCRTVVARTLESHRIGAVRYGVLDRAYAMGALVRALWLSGRADEATQTVHNYLREASWAGHPLVYCTALIETAPVLIWSGHLTTAAEAVDRLIESAALHALAPFREIGQAWRAVLEIKSGNLEAGTALLRECLSAMTSDKHRVLALVFSCHLAEALALRQDFDLALASVDKALAEAENEGRRYRLPEIMRIKGTILAEAPNGDPESSEACLRHSAALAREQSALAWELMATLSLARLWRRQGRFEEARSALEGVYAQFTEGFDTADLVAARTLLDALRAANARTGGKGQ